MIWDFKRTLYCTARKIPARRVTDLADEDVRAKIQQFLDSERGNPAREAESEYSHYFERVYPTETDRRRYMEQLIRGVQPSFGHKVLALLLRHKRINIVWTTNFDKLVETALTAISAGETPVVGTLDTPHVAVDAINEHRWPVVVKLHGDYQSRKLKNTSGELQRQDELLRRAFVDCCRRNGLAVVGYSGRDESIMDALREAVRIPGAFPQGLFWFHRGDAAPLGAVKNLVEEAKSLNIDSEIVQCETFDELLGDLLLLEDSLPEDDVAKLTPPARVSDAPLPPSQGGWPIIRLNAIPITSLPSNFRLVECDIGGTKAVREAVTVADRRVLAARCKNGVIAFGSDADLRHIFNPFKIKKFILMPVDEHRLRYENSISGLMLEALAYALSRNLDMIAERHRHFHVLRPRDPGAQRWEPVIQACRGRIAGEVEGRAWAEAVRLRLAHHLGRPWLVVDPRVWMQETDNPQDRLAEFVRERIAGRYNRDWLSVLDAWLHSMIGGSGHQVSYAALGVADGVDAIFELRSVTAASGAGR